MSFIVIHKSHLFYGFVFLRFDICQWWNPIAEKVKLVRTLTGVPGLSFTVNILRSRSFLYTEHFITLSGGPFETKVPMKYEVPISTEENIIIIQRILEINCSRTWKSVSVVIVFKNHHNSKEYLIYHCYHLNRRFLISYDGHIPFPSILHF